MKTGRTLLLACACAVASMGHLCGDTTGGPVGPSDNVTNTVTVDIDAALEGARATATTDVLNELNMTLNLDIDPADVRLDTVVSVIRDRCPNIDAE